MGEAKSTAELTVEDIQSQLSEEEKLQLADRISSGLEKKQPPRFLIGLKSNQANINEPFRFTVQGNLVFHIYIFKIKINFNYYFFKYK